MKKLLPFILIFFILIEITLRIAGNLYLNKLYFSNLNGINSNSSVNIVCLGESSTAGLWVKWQDSYPVQLETRLRKFYSNNIKVIIPPHVGQNTSQVANRMNSYIRIYKPKLIILMVGANNEWSLAESHITRFIDNNDTQALRVKIMVILDNLRIFKTLRYLFLKFIINDKSEYMHQNKYYTLGHPELARFPPEKWIYSFANDNQGAFIKMWRYDVRNIIRQAKKHNIKVLLMTYHINPNYLSVDEFISMASEENVPLIRNDQSFETLIKNGTIRNFILDDGWHPNKDGYSIIADRVFEYIKDNRLL